MTEDAVSDWRVNYHPKIGKPNTVQVVWVNDGSNVAYGIEISAYAELLVMEHNRAVAAEKQLAVLRIELDEAVSAARTMSQRIDADTADEFRSNFPGIAAIPCVDDLLVENAALRARVAEVERIATNYRESDADDKEGVYRVGLTVIRDMLRGVILER
jgi:hypothetical protein